VTNPAQSEVDILITPANDTRMYAESAAAITQLRAVENGVALVRAAHGLTLITDYEGRVLGSQDYFTNSSGGILMTTVPTRGVTTLYSQIGDLFAYLCAVALVVLAGRAFVRRERPAAIPGHLPA
jgi:apolipoprotein N-acyltransferase